MEKFLVSDTITEWRSYHVMANSEKEAMKLVEEFATDKPTDDIHPDISFVDRGITDRDQQIEVDR
jgi:hypothetical protein